MSQESASHDVDWYRDRWQSLQDILSVADPDAVVPQVRELQLDALQDQAEVLADTSLTDAGEAKQVLKRVHDELKTLREESRALSRIHDVIGTHSPSETARIVESLARQRQTLREAGFETPRDAVDAIESMQQQLDDLYSDKEATVRTERRIEEELGDADTFEQLQKLLAREEKLQRELGVSSSEEVIEMVNGLAEQLEELYGRQEDVSSEEQAREMPAPGGDGLSDADGVAAVTQQRIESLLDRERRLENELGVSSPEEVITMVRDLADQLNELYEARERLARINLDDADSVLQMVTSMQEQLEHFYSEQEQMSERGIEGVEHALAMIESMEQQLQDLYEERERLVESGDIDADGETAQRIEELQEQLEALSEEKEMLMQRRERLRKENETYEETLDTLEENVGTKDPQAIASMIESMEQQLNDIYADVETMTPDAPETASGSSLVTASILERLPELSQAELDDLSVGVFGVDDQGEVHVANEAACDFPGVTASSPRALDGRNFFFELAPATNNALFRGHFLAGVQQASMNEQFPYTYIGKQTAPVNLAVQLYRPPDHDRNWILFRRL